MATSFRARSATHALNAIKAIAVVAAVSVGPGCEALFDNRPEGFRLARLTGGPTVVFDLDAQPLPEIPFPNDLATRPDETSPTGRRLNLSLIGATLLEQEVRAKADQLDGFGLFAPITVNFDARIDVADLRERHLDRSTVNDAVYLINVDPQSKGFGELVWLDVGYFAELPEAMRLDPDHRASRTGRFTSILDRPDKYFDYDPRVETSSLMFETVLEEDLDLDGEFDPEEDTDNDGLRDVPNTIDGVAHPPGSVAEADAIIPFYEFSTDTLIVRPVVPLREATTYAVVLSRFITDEQGRPIQSPFVYVNHARQTDALAPLETFLPKHGLDPDAVAFAWTFTTQSATRELEALRRGLYGDGVLSWLADDYPAELTGIFPWTTDAAVEACRSRAPNDAARARCEPVPSVNALDARKFRVEIGPIVASVAGGEDAEALIDSYRYMDYFIAGTVNTPYFLEDRDGLDSGDGYPQDDDESFEIDLNTGAAVVGDDRVTFWCAIPQSLDYIDVNGNPARHEPPFPVVFYGHSYGSARFEMLGFAGHHARFGLATCALDAMGHGLTLPEEILDLKPVLEAVVAGAGLEVDAVLGAITEGRHRDLNNDGVKDSGGDFWTADTFHTRDMVRQTTVDFLQLVRVLRSFDGERKSSIDLDGDGDRDELAGDFNGDGVVDLGGPDNDYFSWGQSLGGILSVLAPAVEPALVAAAPTAGGAGLVDIAVRSRNPGVPEAVVLRMMGPMIIGEPVADDAGESTGRYRLSWLVPNTSPPGGTPRAAQVVIGEYALDDGDVVVVRNLSREANLLLPPPDRRAAHVTAGQGFRTQFAADAWSATEKRAIMGFDPRDPQFEPVAMTEAQVLASGDRFRLEIYSKGETDEPRLVVDTWQDDVAWQGTVYPAGAPLVAPAEGLGHIRQSADLRRFFGIAQAILDAGDPGSYAARYFNDPIDFTDIEPDRLPETRAIIVPTTGDQLVPVNSEISLARAMGIVDYQRARPDLHGLTEDDFLLAVGAYEGTTRVPRWVDERGAYNFDVDDLDNGTDGLATDPRGNFKLRLTKRTPGGGIAAMRMPYTARSNRDADTHGFDPSTPSRPFDINTFAANQISLFFLMRGEGLTRAQLDAPCLQYLGDHPDRCEFAPAYPAE